jgi:hypothetical protein
MVGIMAFAVFGNLTARAAAVNGLYSSVPKMGGENPLRIERHVALEQYFRPDILTSGLRRMKAIRKREWRPSARPMRVAQPQ